MIVEYLPYPFAEMFKTYRSTKTTFLFCVIGSVSNNFENTVTRPACACLNLDVKNKMRLVFAV